MHAPFLRSGAGGAQTATFKGSGGLKRKVWARASIHLLYTLGVSRRVRPPGDKTSLGRFDSHVKEGSDVEGPEVKVVGNIGLWYRKL